MRNMRKRRRDRRTFGLADGKEISPEYVKHVFNQRNNLAGNPTRSEKAFDKQVLPHLNRLQLNIRPQSVFFVADQVSFIADYEIKGLKCVIEIDGSSHRNKKAREYDSWRDGILKQIGYQTIRISNELVERHPDKALETIITAIDSTVNPSNRIYKKLVSARKRRCEQYPEPVGIQKGNK